MSTPNNQHEQIFILEIQDKFFSTAIVKLSRNELLTIRLDSQIQRRILREIIKISDESSQINSFSNENQKRMKFWYKPWTWFRKKKLDSNALLKEEKKDLHEWEMREIETCLLMEYLCRIIEKDEFSEFGNHLFNHLKSLPIREQERAYDVLHIFASNCQENMNENGNFYFFQNVAEELLKLNPLSYWMIN